MPTDPLSPDFAERIKRMKIGERITMTAAEFEHAMDPQPLALACRSCDCDPPSSFAEALQDGWTELMEDKTADWDYLGLCPACRAKGSVPAETVSDEAVVCHACSVQGPASPAAALKAGWVVLSFSVPDGYVGMCPACEAKRVESEVARMQRETQEAVYCCASPQLEWNGDPVAPGIACESCGYVVAELGTLVNCREEPDAEEEPRDPQKALF
jgi:hypothetical protein